MTFPSGPHDPWQQQPPQQFGGPPQYPPPPPYGPPPQYGPPSQFGPQQPYGYPQQPYGYGPPPQPSGGGHKGLIIGGIAAAVLALVVIVGIVIVIMMPSSDERAIGRLFENIANTSGDISEMKQYFCSSDQEFFEMFDTSILGDLGIDIPQPTIEPPEGTVEEINVDGDRATVTVKTGARTDTVYLRKESGEWKACLSDSPGMPPLP